MKNILLPNCIPFTLIAVYVLAALVGCMPGHVAGHIAFAGITLLVAFILFAQFGSIGGGIAKFAVAASLWIGPNSVFLNFLLITGIGGFIVYLVNRKFHGESETIPLTIVVIVAFIICLPDTPAGVALTKSLTG